MSSGGNKEIEILTASRRVVLGHPLEQQLGIIEILQERLVA